MTKYDQFQMFLICFNAKIDKTSKTKQNKTSAIQKPHGKCDYNPNKDTNH